MAGRTNMAYGQVTSSSGRVLNYTPEGWINNEGDNLNAAPANQLAQLAMSQPQQAQMQPQQPGMNRLAQVAQGGSLSDFLDANGTSMKNLVDYNGKKAFRVADGVVWQNPDGSTGKATFGEVKNRPTEKDLLDMEAKRANIAQTQAQTAALAQPKTKPAPDGYRFTADGNMEFVPGGPADVKAGAIAQQKALGASDVDLALGTLRDAYDRLEKGGGITSTTNGMLDNLSASTSASGVGQTVGKMFGTDNQSARNDVAMTRPALLAALMKATGMSAKQMDSNAELKLWLATATDPTLDVQANRRALDKIEQKYIPGARQKPTPTGGGYQDPAKEQRYQAWLKSQGR